MARRSAIAKTGISEDALLWVRVRKVLQKKGAAAAQEYLRKERAEEAFKGATSGGLICGHWSTT